MKNNLIFIITALLCCFTSCAQSETFDITTYKSPAGWEKETKNGRISLSTTDEAKGNYCIISIYASTPSSGTSEEEFVKAWQDLVVTPFQVQDEPQIEKATDDGRVAIAGTAAFQTSSGTSVVMLTTIVGYGRTVNIITMSNGDAYQKEIEDFLGSLTLKKTAPAVNTKTTTTNTKQTTTNTGSIFHNSNPIEGVWMTLHLQSMYYDGNSSGSPKWMTFYDNGKVYESLPENLYTFDKNSSNLGTYQFSNGNGFLKWFPQSPATAIIAKNTDDILVRLSSGDDNYHRCKSVDGLRLQGSWTSYANPNSPDLDDHSIERPMITFNSNGSFTDYGIFSLLDISKSSKALSPPGSGTYSINNFMLTLNYSNGTTRQVSFTGLLSSDVSINNNSIYLHRTKFNKRNN